MAPFQLPPSPTGNTVRVRMYDTTCLMYVGAKDFVEPVIPGHELFNLTDVTFFIENEALGKKALWDLGCKKDWWNASPAQASRIKRLCAGLSIEKGADEIMVEAG